jgi:hypothetical protein
MIGLHLRGFNLPEQDKKGKHDLSIKGLFHFTPLLGVMKEKSFKMLTFKPYPKHKLWSQVMILHHSMKRLRGA